MKMKTKTLAAVAAALLAGSFQASATTVEVATGDWSNIPWAERRAFNIISGDAVERIHKSFADGSCKLRGQTRDRINLRVPFLMKFAPDGSVERIVVRKLGCPAVESVLGSSLLRQVKSGDYKATGQNDALWYRSEVLLTST